MSGCRLFWYLSAGIRGQAMTSQDAAVKNPFLRVGRKLIVAIIGGTVVLIGLALIVLPGPAIVVIPLGLAILGTEFLWARRLLRRLHHGASRALQRPTTGKSDT